MRVTLAGLVLLLGLSSACTVENEIYDGPCDQLLRCVAVAEPGKLSEQVTTYGAGGTCWKSVPSNLCEQTCTSMLHDYETKTSGLRECRSGSFGQDAIVPDAAVSTDGGLGDAATLADGATPADAASGDMTAPPTCGPATCGGCCLAGVCQPGTANSACGGNGAACVVCASPKVCDSAARTCGADPNELISLTIYDADIYSRKYNGDPWDFPSGYPDVFVTIDGVRRTTVEDDTIYPYWDKTLYLTRRELMTTGVYVAVWDEDISYNDRISYSKLLRVTDADLLAGQIEWRSWDDVKRIQFNVSR